MKKILSNIIDSFIEFGNSLGLSDTGGFLLFVFVLLASIVMLFSITLVLPRIIVLIQRFKSTELDTKVTFSQVEQILKRDAFKIDIDFSKINSKSVLYKDLLFTIFHVLVDIVIFPIKISQAIAGIFNKKKNIDSDSFNAKKYFSDIFWNSDRIKGYYPWHRSTHFDYEKYFQDGNDKKLEEALLIADFRDDHLSFYFNPHNPNLKEKISELNNLEDKQDDNYYLIDIEASAYLYSINKASNKITKQKLWFKTNAGDEIFKHFCQQAGYSGGPWGFLFFTIAMPIGFYIFREDFDIHSSNTVVALVLAALMWLFYFNSFSRMFGSYQGFKQYKGVVDKALLKLIKN